MAIILRGVYAVIYRACVFMLVQFVFLLVLFGAFFMTWRRARQQVISLREALSWSVLWIGAAVVVVLPQTASTVAHFFGVGRGADFVVYGSIIALFLLVFRVFIMLEQLERKLTQMVQRDALKDVLKK